MRSNRSMAAARVATPRLFLDNVFIGKNVLSISSRCSAITSIWSGASTGAYVDGMDIEDAERTGCSSRLLPAVRSVQPAERLPHAIQHPAGEHAHQRRRCRTVGVPCRDGKQPAGESVPHAAIARAVGLGAPGNLDAKPFEVIDAIAALLASTGICRARPVESRPAEHRCDRTAESATASPASSTTSQDRDLDAMRRITRAAFRRSPVAVPLDADDFHDQHFTIFRLAPTARLLDHLLIGESWREGRSQAFLDVEDPSRANRWSSARTAPSKIALLSMQQRRDLLGQHQLALDRNPAASASSGSLLSRIGRLQLISLRTGKSLADARPKCSTEFFRWYAEEVHELGDLPRHRAAPIAYSRPLSAHRHLVAG